ncbi:MAG: hypothetical protein PWP71_1545 [Clostridia bacterium]|jgi:hypothetical protein|nr:hypothetical protein [Clostridia bacterium]
MYSMLNMVIPLFFMFFTKKLHKFTNLTIFFIKIRDTIKKPGKITLAFLLP